MQVYELRKMNNYPDSRLNKCTRYGHFQQLSSYYVFQCWFYMKHFEYSAYIYINTSRTCFVL